MRTKKTLLIVIAVLISAALLIVISLFYKTSDSELQSGTIVKAERYRKTTMTENDLRLRSEFTRDTNQLRGMIQGLKYFSEFNGKVANRITQGMQEFQNHPILMDQLYNRTFFSLQDYGLYLQNNADNLSATETMLQAFRKPDPSNDPSFDVEKNLRDFGNFISQVSERDTVLEGAAKTIDRYLDKKRKAPLMAQEVSDLKKFRDQLLIDNLMTAAMLGEKTTLKRLSDYAKKVDPGIDLISMVGTLGSQSVGSNMKSAADLQAMQGLLSLGSQLQAVGLSSRSGD